MAADSENEASAVTPEDMTQFMRMAFPGGEHAGTVVEARRDFIRMSFNPHPKQLRPEGMVTGPVQMALADIAAYLVIFTRTGIVLGAMTTNLNMNFLRPCMGAPVWAEARILRLGRTTVISEVQVRGNDMDKPSAHAIVTYALPQERG